MKNTAPFLQWVRWISGWIIGIVLCIWLSGGIPNKDDKGPAFVGIVIFTLWPLLIGLAYVSWKKRAEQYQGTWKVLVPSAWAMLILFWLFTPAVCYWIIPSLEPYRFSAHLIFLPPCIAIGYGIWFIKNRQLSKEIHCC